MKLRKYQKNALKLALQNKKTILVLPTGTGKTIIGAEYVKHFLSMKKRCIVLEPTRILVEQVYNTYRALDIPCTKIYGIIQKNKRKTLWKKSKVVITTPETAYNDLEFSSDFDVVVIDECHHAIGDDAYAKFLRESKAEYRLGLSAYVSKKIEKELESYIGSIYRWSLSDEDIRKYIPQWISDVYETPFNESEIRAYNKIEQLQRKSKNKMIFTLALKYFACDGAIALKDTLSRENRISEVLSTLKLELIQLRDLHKIEKLNKVLEIYDFEKSIIFVDRVITAKYLYNILKKHFCCSLLIGKKYSSQNIGELKNSKIIISTSAGEEGVDLPEIDLLVVWSNTSSPLRFIQRQGRVMRIPKIKDKVKFVIYLITPNTIDTDMFLQSALEVRKYIDVGIDETVIKKLWKKSGYSKILSLLSYPMYLEWIVKMCRKPKRFVYKAISYGIRIGEIIYIHTPMGKLYVRKSNKNILFSKRFRRFLNPIYQGKIKLHINGRTRTFEGDFKVLINKLEKYLPLDSLTVIVKKKLKDIVEYIPVTYRYLIDDRSTLEIVLRNSLSKLK